MSGAGDEPVPEELVDGAHAATDNRHRASRRGRTGEAMVVSFEGIGKRDPRA
jgi:hypothetical protein